MKNVKLYVLMLILSFLLNSCNLEKITGYKYDAQKPDKTVKISGNIINTFEDFGIIKAKVQIGVFETLTDGNGDYVLANQKGEDEDQNRPVPLKIIAENYYDFTDEIIMGEFDVNYDAELVYGAPMAERVFLTSVDEGNSLINVVIKDYQGFHNVSEVIGIFWITESASSFEEVPHETVIQFTKGRQLTPNIGIYSAIISNYWLNIDPFNSSSAVHFSLSDYDGFQDDSFPFCLSRLTYEY